MKISVFDMFEYIQPGTQNLFVELNYELMTYHTTSKVPLSSGD